MLNVLSRLVMCRVYKFRGRRVDNSEWVYGSLHTDGMGNCHILQGRVIDCRLGSGSVYTVYRDSVGQFVGLLDSLGREIYEGDMCYYGGSKTMSFEVVYFRSAYCLSLGGGNYLPLTDFFEDDEYNTGYVKVNESVEVAVP